MHSKRMIMRLGAVPIALALVLSACSSPAATTAPAPTTAATTASSTDWSTAKEATEGGGLDALVAAAKAEGQLNVITLPRDWCDYGDMMDNFTAKYGIKVNS